MGSFFFSGPPAASPEQKLTLSPGQSRRDEQTPPYRPPYHDNRNSLPWGPPFPGAFCPSRALAEDLKFARIRRPRGRVPPTRTLNPRRRVNFRCEGRLKKKRDARPTDHTVCSSKRGSMANAWPDQARTISTAVAGADQNSSDARPKRSAAHGGTDTGCQSRCTSRYPGLARRIRFEPARWSNVPVASMDRRTMAVRASASLCGGHASGSGWVATPGKQV